MKKLLTFIAFGMILPMLVFSCGDNDVIIDGDDKEITGGNDNDSTSTDIEPIDFWDENNFQPLNDEFNDFREFQAGLLFPYDLDNPYVQNYFGNTSVVLGETVNSHERVPKGYVWIEVTYPKEDPSKMQYSVYGYMTARGGISDYLWKDYQKGTIISDETVIRTYNFFRDGEIIATIDQLPHKKFIININDTSQLLYDFHRVALASNDMLYSNNTTDTQEVYSYQDIKDNIVNSDARLDEYYFAKDPYGGKVLGIFGSLTSFLLPVNGPCDEDMVQEVIGLREGVVFQISDSKYIDRVLGSFRFIYKNSQSPAAPYLPEYVWDLNKLSIVDRLWYDNV